MGMNAAGPDSATSGSPLVPTREVHALGALTGVLAAGLTLGVAELIAVVTGPETSPVIAVGGAAIDGVPASLKDFAIRSFGTHDKTVLVAGILVVLVVLAAVLGAASVRRRAFGLTSVAVLGLVGALAAVTRPGAGSLSVVPSVIGAVCGAVALFGLLRRLSPADARAAAGPTHANDPNDLGGGPADVMGGALSRARAEVVAGDRTHLNRRGFFLAGGLTAVVAVGAGGAGRALLGRRLQTDQSRAAVRLPAPTSTPRPLPSGVDLKVPGLAPFRTSTANFYRVDTALIVPQLVAANWRLRIHGMVRREVTLTFAELLDRELIERDITLCCVSNPVGGSYIGNSRWMGARLKPLITLAGPRSGADQVLSSSADGFTAGAPTSVLTDGRDAMLAVAMNGQPLPARHGFPVRMVVPGLYGYVSATKWVVDLELTTFAGTRAYWAERGWSRRGPIKTESRIDTPHNGDAPTSGRVAVAGVAWAQHTGIAKVEVRVDDGPWQVARLSDQDTIDTWRQWLYEWDAKKGGHRLQVRATDRSGYTQTSTVADTVPNGATGWDTIHVTIR